MLANSQDNLLEGEDNLSGSWLGLGSSEGAEATHCVLLGHSACTMRCWGENISGGMVCSLARSALSVVLSGGPWSDL